MRVLVEEKAGEKVLGFEYLKADAPVRPRDPEDSEPDGEGPENGVPKGPPKAGRPKPRVRRAPRRPRAGRQRSVGASLVPKVPLGTK